MRPARHLSELVIRPRRERGGIFGSLIVLLFFALLGCLLYLARHPLMRWGANWWIIEDTFERADAIIVLSDDNFFADRASRAAELFRQGKAPWVVASGRRLRPNAGLAELMEHDLIERGVPKDHIVRAPHDSDSTGEEAVELLRLTRQRNWRSLIVVTSNYHTRRARYIFRKVFPQAIEVYVASARDGDFDPDQWWMKRKSIKQLMRELAAMVVAIWEQRGENRTKSVPQSVVQGKVFHPQPVV